MVVLGLEKGVQCIGRRSTAFEFIVCVSYCLCLVYELRYTHTFTVI
jgi:hypothetical protein